jgi:hypothetical protein
MRSVLSTPALTAASQAVLTKLTTELNGTNPYSGRVARAKALWDGKMSSKAKKAAFDEIKATLTAACSGHRRCNYCEDSVADEIEHVRPKDLYPELCFTWTNYLYACGPCNGPKGALFAVFVGASDVPVEIGRKDGDPVVPPTVGPPALLDPRVDDPLDFFFVDLASDPPTFVMVPLPGLSSRDDARAKYTERILHLNDRVHLVAARRTSYEALVSALVRVAAARAGLLAEPVPLATSGAREVVSNTPHRFVWEIMKRHRQKLPKIDKLFGLVPEALAW